MEQTSKVLVRLKLTRSKAFLSVSVLTVKKEVLYINFDENGYVVRIQVPGTLSLSHIETGIP